MQSMRKRLVVLVGVLALLASVFGAYGAVAHAAPPNSPPPSTNPPACQDQYGFTSWKARETWDKNWNIQYRATTGSNWWVGVEWDQRFDAWWGIWCPGIQITGIGEIDLGLVPGIGYVCLAGNADPSTRMQSAELSGKGWRNGTQVLSQCTNQVALVQTTEYWDTTGCFTGYAQWQGSSQQAHTKQYCF